jgi:hypothetical protein
MRRAGPVSEETSNPKSFSVNAPAMKGGTLDQSQTEAFIDNMFGLRNNFILATFLKIGRTVCPW